MIDSSLFKVGIYIRLSKEDDNKPSISESESVINQRKLIYAYLVDNNYKNIREYIDDGYSGTSFDRPAFVNLINDIENGVINMVITKDLSRLGRDYIRSGYFLEDYFPSKHVRYVAILDGIDTFLDDASNDIAPFKALFNDMVAKDTSKKIKSILKNKKQQGLFLGNSAPFGYKKDVTDKHKLVVDNDTSYIVKRIFRMIINNRSINEIVDILNKENIITPLSYKKGTSSKWTYNSVYNIVKNQEYTGCLVQNVWTTVSYKNKKRIKRDAENWIVINDAHEAIIDFKIYQKANTKVSKKIIKKDKFLLDNLVYCKECGSLLKCYYVKSRHYWIMQCPNYRKKCSSHYVNYYKLEKEIINNLSRNGTIKLENQEIQKWINKINISKNKSIEIIHRNN